MIGILSATGREASPLLNRLGIHRCPQHGDDSRVRCHYHVIPGHDAVIMVSGIGVDAARKGTEQLITAHGATSILNTGICGLVAGNHKVGDIFRVSHTRFWDDPKDDSWECGSGGFGDFPVGRLTTCAEAVFDPEQRAIIGQWGQLVDMEGAAVAETSAEYGIPVCLLKGVSDTAGEGGREMLMSNIDAVSEALAAVVWERLFTRGAQQ